MKRPEQEIHQALVKHLKQRGVPGLVWWHTPQGAFYGNARQGAIMKSLGTRPGVSDILAVHEGKIFALELKADKGRPSESQLEFLSDIERAGAFTAMPRGLNAAIATLEAWGLLRGVTT